MNKTQRILLFGIGTAISLGSLGMHRDEAQSLPVPEWDRDHLAQVQWQCLNAITAPSTVVYEEDPSEATRLIEQAGYTQLGEVAARRPSQAWDELMQLPGIQPDSSDLPGAAVFLHERFTPSGQRLLVYAAYRPSLRIEGRGELEIRVLGVDSLAHPPRMLGRHVYDDFWLFYLWTRPVQQVLPHPGPHTLRLFAGQPDSSDPSRFSFGYEIDGVFRTMVVKILDPDPESDTPDWPRVKVFSEPIPGC